MSHQRNGLKKDNHYLKLLAISQYIV